MHIQIQFFISISFYIQVYCNLSCPSFCKCGNNNEVVCKHHSLQSIPDSISSDVKRLDVSFNSINTLPANAFKKFNKLVFLRLSHNDMKQIDKDAFQGLGNLKDLHLENNDLSYLHPETFNKLISLLHVYLGDNEFKIIPSLKNSQMTKLNLDSNKINSALINESFLLNSGLKTLVLTKNYIKRIEKDDFRNLRNTQIKSIMLKMNELEYINSEAFSHVKNSLSTLELEKNGLLNSSILEEALKGFHGGGGSMQYLELIGCGLTTISDQFFKPLFGSKLHQLDFSYNSQLKTVHEDAFEGLKHVQILHMANCKINSSKIRFTGMIDLKKLYINNNNLVKCPDRLPGSIIIINLEYNNIRKIIKDNFKSLTSLELLLLKNNAIDTIEPGSFEDLNKLQLLDISYNRLSTFEPGTFSRMPSLITLDLSQQRPCIKELKGNSLVLSNLQVLNLEENCIGDEPSNYGLFANLPMLQNLSLKGNHLKTLSDHIFDQCSSLKHVNLSHNQLSAWSPHTFVPLKSSVTHITLDFNDISNISMETYSNNYLPFFPSLQQISMYNNKWNCTCDNIAWLLAFKDKLQMPGLILCTSPNEKSGRRLFHEMHQCPTKLFDEQLGPHHSNRTWILMIVLLIVILLAVPTYRFRKNIISRIKKCSMNNPRNYSNLRDLSELNSTDSDLINIGENEGYADIGTPQSRLIMNVNSEDVKPHLFANPHLEPSRSDLPTNHHHSTGDNQLPISNRFSKEYSENTEKCGTNPEANILVDVAREPHQPDSDWKVQLRKIKENPVDISADIVLVTNDYVPEAETNMELMQIRNLQTDEERRTVLLCDNLVIDYPPPDRDILIELLKVRDLNSSNYIILSKTRISELEDAQEFGFTTNKIELYHPIRIWNLLRNIG